ncbi:hypothetical protein PPL_08994 [Heterostelium album PN500]|uniref:Asl1-like glycosyl hydrolase catalytic domain-containing protein n=1 Tax=Heterostelium pallidum (strain ATCC 26659 / Pp 5 / PN500) TaxID=670386 RepID=D3BKB3_HETP5|nr:hypothetical protein PPL_08994 [Heterostelium album PN500]EFA78343.1 hypothetical protein PPL_08994 [Heterostelium album PN500]|eukprot:XP_020430468.1 hypothetical protein PPL_08994 [Heterostelium album PN500]
MKKINCILFLVNIIIGSIVIDYNQVMIVSAAISTKKGVTYGADNRSQSIICNDLASFNVSWYYNWGKQPSCQAGVQGVEYDPMVWGKANLPVGNIAPGNWIMGFNEPNFIGQADLSPSAAAALWPQIQQTGRKNVLAGLADCGGVGGNCKYNTVQWAVDFLGNCTNCQVDAIAVHQYYCSASDVMTKINRLYQATKKPIWLSEFACNGASSYQQVIDFAKELLPQLESSTVVERYSWFIHWCQGCKSSDLLYSSLLYDNGTMTPFGVYYSSFGTNSSSGTTTTTSTTATTTTTTSTTGDNNGSKLSTYYIVIVLAVLLSLLLV